MSDLSFVTSAPAQPNVGQVWYWTNAKDSLFITYVNVPWWQAATPQWYGSNSFQIFLDGSDSSITYRYQTMFGAFQDNTGCNTDIMIGIENQTGNIGLQCFTEVVPANNYAIKFKYPATVLISVPDVSPVWNQNTENGGMFFPTGLVPYLNSNLKNVGNVAITTNTALSGRLRNLANTIIYSSTFNLASMAVGQDTLVTFNPQATVTTPGQYYFEASATNAQDINAGNNNRITEIGIVNMSGPTAQLTYCTGGTPTGSLGWNSGALDDGVAVYMEPPIYPLDINSIEVYISSNTSETMIVNIYDDNGPNGAAGTILFTTTVPAASIVAGSWNTVYLPTSLTISSGGFYVGWLMGGPNIFIGTETSGPISRRSYEILGGAWATYRDNTLQDFLIRVNVGNYPCAITANYSYVPTATTLQFTNGSTGSTSYLWDFGDGATSTATSPSHTYAAVGTYNVCLISTNACGSDTACQSILVSCPSPGAAFSYTANGITAQFTDNTSGGPTSWAWDFGDGSTSTQQNPSHTYANQGTYTVCLIATSLCGADTTCFPVTVCIQPVLNFSNTNNGAFVSFSNTSSGASTWLWDFGDGNTSTAQNPTHQYSTAGFYLVCLFGDNGCTSDSLCLTIQVCVPPTPAFGTTPNQLSVAFNNTTSTNGPTTWNWDFGDGNTSTAQNPSHTYAAAGFYTVCLTATDSCASDTTCLLISVSGTIGISDPAQLGLEAYPNPVSEMLSVRTSLPAGLPGSLRLIDLTGRVIWRIEATEAQEIPVGHLAKGMYSLELQCEGYTRRLMVVRQ